MTRYSGVPPFSTLSAEVLEPTHAPTMGRSFLTDELQGRRVSYPALASVLQARLSHRYVHADSFDDISRVQLYPI